MATSGTWSFTVNRDDIIGAALRALYVYSAGDTISAADISSCAQALNIVTKNLVTKGALIWCVQDVTIPLVAGQATYTLNLNALPSSGGKPMKILQAYLRDSTGNDVDLSLVARRDYNLLGNKSSQGIPNQLFYDPQVSVGNITLYNVPIDATRTLHLVIQRNLMDFNLATDNPDFPQEWYHPLKWLLAEEIMSDYDVPSNRMQYVAGKAMTSLSDALAFSQEDVSLTFSLDTRGG